jgi:hypothetical protein
MSTPVDTNDASAIFTTFAIPLIKSADQPQTMMEYSALAITSWNLSDLSEEGIKNGIEYLEKKLKCKELTNHGTTTPIEVTMRKLIEKKNKDFSSAQFKVAGANFVDENGELKIIVTVQQ